MGGEIVKIRRWSSVGVAEIPDQEIAHCLFCWKLGEWRFHFEESREGVAAAR